MLKHPTRNTAIFKNFTFLSIIQFVQSTVIFLTYPYLIKTFGQEKYGIIVYAQAIVGYFTIIINYGFNATATKEVALNKDDNSKLNEIVSSIFTAKLYLFLISLILFLVLVTNVKVLSYHKWIYLWTFLSTAGWVIFPEKNARSIRPRYGLHPKHYIDVIGKKVKVDLEKGTPFSLDYLNQ